MAVPDFQSLMLPVLMATASGEISASDLRDRVAKSVHLDPADLGEMLPSGRQTTFANRTAWANVFLPRAGLIENQPRCISGNSDGIKHCRREAIQNRYGLPRTVSELC